MRPHLRCIAVNQNDVAASVTCGGRLPVQQIHGVILCADNGEVGSRSEVLPLLARGNTGSSSAQGRQASLEWEGRERHLHLVILVL